jgi:hypothetical protein
MRLRSKHRPSSCSSGHYWYSGSANFGHKSQRTFLKHVPIGKFLRTPMHGVAQSVRIKLVEAITGRTFYQGSSSLSRIRSRANTPGTAAPRGERE